MPRSLRAAFLSLCFPLLALSAPQCSDFVLDIAAETQNVKITLPELDITNPNLLNDVINSALGNVGDNWPILPLHGEYKISARFCEPENVVKERANTVQFLVHGFTYTKTYWTGLDLPQELDPEHYSWVDYASKQGYPTLIIDRMGAGKSTRGDPLLEAQVNMNAEIIHQIVKQLREGKIGGRKFEKVIYTGHSLGSVTGVATARKHPGDFDVVILTGWSSTFLVEFLLAIVIGVPLPATINQPLRFFGFNPAYVNIASKPGMAKLFYGAQGTYNPVVFEHDWEMRDAAPLGDLLTIYAGEMILDAYEGFVHIITGEQDFLFCGIEEKCMDTPNNILAKSQSVFPNAKSFTYDIIPETGHDLNLHNSAPQTFKAAHDFLEKVGF